MPLPVIPLFRLISFPLFLGSSALGVTWHVDPRGDDSKGTGSAELPWKSIQKALDECAAGDAVLMHAGAYGQRVEFHESGTPGKPLTLMAEEGAFLTGKGMPKGDHAVAIYGQSHIRILGLEIRDTFTRESGCGIYVEGGGRGIEIRNCYFHHLKGKEAGAIGVFGTVAAAALTDIVIDGCRIEHCQPAPSEALVLNGNVDGFRVTNNQISDINNIGIDFIGGEKDIMPDVTKVARRGVCSGNRVVRARSTYEDGYAAGIYVDGGRDIVISGNTVTECDLGIEIGAENAGQTTRSIIVEDNVLYRNDKAGLVFGGYDRKKGRVTACLFRRNILWQNTSHKDAQAELWIQEAMENRFEGNTIVASPRGMMAQVVPGGVRNQFSANRWWSSDGEATAWTWGSQEGTGFTAWTAASGGDTLSIWQQPQYEDPANGKFAAK
jgi:parallel beta-helix repeat protein